MAEFISRAFLISYYPPLLLGASIFIFFVGFMYGYAVSFIFGMKKTLTIGFFVVVVGTILILLFSSAFILATQCTPFGGGAECPDSLSIVSRAVSSLMLLLSHLFINLILGHTGVILGIGFYFPSEWFIGKYTKLPLPKKTMEEYEKIQQSQQDLTSGNLSFQGIEQATQTGVNIKSR